MMAEHEYGETCPLAIVDVDYRPTIAVAVAVVAKTWDAPSAMETRIARIADVKPYRPGAFFERELPCILQVVSMLQSDIRTIVIDGYVDLDEHGRPGLGAHLHSHFQNTKAVVGVAKTAFHGADFAAHVLRGSSRKPLFVTARGIQRDVAAAFVRRMHGSHRLPTLIKEVDTLARGS
ncbi:MAG TPA: endonuclease V [Polyangium sp.]|jgi:deoxyribonuclease V|nr:endonuclease V [Polyangium sp.]